MAKPSDIEQTIKVSFDIGPDTVIGSAVAYDEDGDFSHHGDVTLADRVAELVAKQIADNVHAELRQSYKFDAAKIAEKKLDERVEALLSDALDKVVTPTDQFGSPKGEPRSVAQIMNDRITAWFTSKAGRDSYQSKTNMQTFMDSAVDHRMKAEMTKAIADAKAEVLSALKDEAKNIMADAVAKIAGGK